MVRDGQAYQDGRPFQALQGVDLFSLWRALPKPEKRPGTPPRPFTPEFKKGARVAIVRYRHGWFRVPIEGRIIAVGEFTCTVRGDDGQEYPIEKPRDIYLTR